MKLKTVFFSMLSILVLGGMTSMMEASAAEKFKLTSNLKPGKAIPADYYANIFGCTAKNESPALEWKNAPAGTQSFAITVHDESAPTGSGFWHYVLIDIPADVHKINAGELSQGTIPAGSIEMMTDAGKPGYRPCPPLEENTPTSLQFMH